MIIQYGIKKIIYFSDKHADTLGTIASKRLLDECKVEYIQLKTNGDIHIKFKNKNV